MTVLAERLANANLTEPQRNLLAGGFCPFCKEPIRGKWRAVKEGWHFFAPEIYETLREAGIDTASGHRTSCSWIGVRLP